MPALELKNTNITVWCHPRSGSHNLMARLRASYINQGIENVGNLYEMFPDHNALVGKEYHSEFILREVANRVDRFTNGLTWNTHNGVLRSERQPKWCYLDELEKRLGLLESNQVPRPCIGKHITWWNLYTDRLKGEHDSYVDRVHQAVASISDRAIILYRHSLSDYAASNEVLNFGFQDAGRRRGRIQTHGPVRILEDDTINELRGDRLERYLQRLIAGFKYLDPQRTVMIQTEELDSADTITWPDGYSMTLDADGKQQFRNTYSKIEQGQQSRVDRALDVVHNREEITSWAQSIDAQYHWSSLREHHGFQRGW